MVLEIISLLYQWGITHDPLTDHCSNQHSRTQANTFVRLGGITNIKWMFISKRFFSFCLKL